MRNTLLIAKKYRNRKYNQREVHLNITEVPSLIPIYDNQRSFYRYHSNTLDWNEIDLNDLMTAYS